MAKDTPIPRSHQLVFILVFSSSSDLGPVMGTGEAEVYPEASSGGVDGRGALSCAPNICASLGIFSPFCYPFRRDAGRRLGIYAFYLRVQSRLSSHLGGSGWGWLMGYASRREEQSRHNEKGLETD